MYAKLILQELWKSKTGWDAEVSGNLEENWNLLCKPLERLGNFSVPRNVNMGNVTRELTVHGFADASERGYGACIYLLSYQRDEQAQVHLLCSKSRVAPLKTITIPRLELYAACLLARLVTVVTKALGPKVKEVHLWSDSTITLHWINTPQGILQTYVATRVVTIQERTQDCRWRHVSSADNPADLLSRGSLAENMISEELWWHGPKWLPLESDWPEQSILPPTGNLEMKATVNVIVSERSIELMRRFSKFSKLQRVLAYCYRFWENLKRKKAGTEFPSVLTVEELERARLQILQWTQQEAFFKELRSLQAGKCVDHSSSLIRLKPFLDPSNLIRVGGRLERAEISEDHKHPIVLPSRRPITTSIMREEHLRLLHCGPNHLLSAIRGRYWPLSGGREARKITQSCVLCRKFKPQVPDYIMSDLPSTRVEVQTRPFEVSGVDYAGPIQVRESKRRGRIPVSKGYIAVFVCFSTKAMHLELVSDLTTEGFLAALRRFTARRGLCRILYSDNGTNFVGASRELKRVYEFQEQNELEIANNLAAKQITWKFIPPRSPHFGGLWEAAVKSVKRHLYTVTKGLLYTFEEYNTLLIEIEQVLNSRPLTPLSSDPSDISCLTPFHFITGSAPSEPGSTVVLGPNGNLLSRWKQIQKIKCEFWKRWRAEYLHHLQTRTRWSKVGGSLKEGDLVLLIDENRPPLQWTLGRISCLHLGGDGIKRVAEVRTNQGTVTRAIKKLCALPIENT